MTAQQRPYRQGKGDRLTYSGATDVEVRCDYAVGPLDAVAIEMDSTWGVDVLPTLVTPALAERYGAAVAHLNACILANDPVGTTAAADNCIRGLRRMDAEARAAGHVPSPPECWIIEANGKRFGFVKDVAQAARAEAAYPGVEVFTLRQAAVALRPALFGLVDAVKTAFPGAEIVATRPAPSPLAKSLDDEIPY